jgi:hypothetical protein
LGQEMSHMSKHDRIYTILLMVMCFGWLLSIGVLANAKPGPSIRLILFINACLLGASVLTLLLRFKKPALGKVATKALNIVLLAGFPIGTALGIYGLWKVDKNIE